MKNIITRALALVTDSGNLSLGRVLLLVCFALAMVKWGKSVEIVGTHLTVLLALIGYVFGTKVLGGVVTKKKGLTQVPDPNQKGD